MAVVVSMKLMSKLKRHDRILLVFSVQAHNEDKQHLNQSNNIGITITLAVIAAGCG
jgi:hypothetical protein